MSIKTTSVVLRRTSNKHTHTHTNTHPPTSTEQSEILIFIFFLPFENMHQIVERCTMFDVHILAISYDASVNVCTRAYQCQLFNNIRIVYIVYDDNFIFFLQQKRNIEFMALCRWVYPIVSVSNDELVIDKIQNFFSWQNKFKCIQRNDEWRMASDEWWIIYIYICLYCHSSVQCTIFPHLIEKEKRHDNTYHTEQIIKMFNEHIWKIQTKSFTVQCSMGFTVHHSLCCICA